MTTRCGSSSRACQATQRTRPWMAFACSGSVSGSWWRVPSNSYVPSCSRLGHGASTWPRPAVAISPAP